MLQNAYLLAKIGADTAENERAFAKIPELGVDALERPHRPVALEAVGPPGDAGLFTYRASKISAKSNKK